MAARLLPEVTITVITDFVLAMGELRWGIGLIMPGGEYLPVIGNLDPAIVDEQVAESQPREPDGNDIPFEVPRRGDLTLPSIGMTIFRG